MKKCSPLFVVLLFFAIIFSIQPILFGDESPVIVKIHPETITVGDPVSITIGVTYQKENTLTPIDLESYLPDMDILEKNIVEKEKKDMFITELHYKATFFKPGSYTIPKIEIEIIKKEGKTEKIFSKPHHIVVESLLEKDKKIYDIRDIKGPFSLPVSIINHIILVFSSILFIMILVWFIIKKYRIKKEVKEKGIQYKLSPEERALHRLTKLENAELLEKNHVKKFYFLLSEIIRRYLQERCGFNALDQTTREILKELRANKIKQGNIEQVKKLFHESDIVKFAKYYPEISLCKENLAEAKNVVKLFTPEEVVTVTSNNSLGQTKEE
ncbi:hypothetical protein ACFL1T_00310 [Chlamydiota bacterium]